MEISYRRFKVLSRGKFVVPQNIGTLSQSAKVEFENWASLIVLYTAEPFYDDPPGDWCVEVLVFCRLMHFDSLSYGFPPPSWYCVGNLDVLGSTRCFRRCYPTSEMGGNLSVGMSALRADKYPRILDYTDEHFVPRFNSFLNSLLH